MSMGNPQYLPVRTLQKSDRTCLQAALGLYDLIVTGRQGEPKPKTLEKFLKAFNTITGFEAKSWHEIVAHAKTLNILTAQLTYAKVLREMYNYPDENSTMEYSIGLYNDFNIGLHDVSDDSHKVTPNNIYTVRDHEGHRYTYISSDLAEAQHFMHHDTPYVEDLSYLGGFILAEDLRNFYGFKDAPAADLPHAEEVLGTVLSNVRSIVAQYKQRYGIDNTSLPYMHQDREDLNSGARSLRQMCFQAPQTSLHEALYPVVFGQVKKAALMQALRDEDIKTVIYLLDQDITLSKDEIDELKSEFSLILKGQDERKKEHDINAQEALHIAETYIAHVTTLSMDEDTKGKDDLLELSRDLKDAYRKLKTNTNDATAKQFVSDCIDTVKKHREAIYRDSRLFRYTMNFLWSLTIVGAAINAGYLLYTSLTEDKARLFFAQPEATKELDQLNTQFTSIKVK